MVQRKVPNKLGIQADHVKAEKLLANLRPSPSQYQDGKNRGPDLKKKMKKSRSIKLSDIESLRSSPLRRNISPPLNLPTTAAITQKQPLMKAEAAPNYMKSTSSSDARKERSQVSLQNIQAGFDSTNPRRRHSIGSTLSSVSGNKGAKTLTRTSSLKLARTLTKSPSFKPARASVKKCSKAALCAADMNAQRATCSSTLKDSQFPTYLTLSHGATESEGTSVMKVCPYTYCSLNGHRHAPLPPLKLFLSARRRSLKAQKSMKLGALSPRKAKRPRDGMKEINTGLLVFDDKPAYEEVDLGDSATSPSIQEVGMDFFVEIYTKNKEDDADAIGESTNVDDEEAIDFFGELEDYNDIPSSFGSGDEAAVEHDDENQVAESPSDGSPHSEIDFDENLGQEMDVAEGFRGEQKVEDPNEYYQPILVQEEPTLGSFGRRSDFEGESCASTEVDDIISEATDMEWEGQFSASESDHQANYSIKTEEESDLNAGYISEIENPELHDEAAVISDDIVSNCEEEILADEVLLEVFEEESACLEAQFSEGDSEQDGINQYLEIQESSQVSDSSSCDQLPSTENVFEALIIMEEKSVKDETDLINTVNSSASKEEPIVDTTAASEEIQEKGVPEAENGTPKTEGDPHEMDEPCHDIAEDTNLSQHIDDESLPADNQNFLEKDQGEAQKLNISSSVDSAEQSDSWMNKFSSPENCTGAVDIVELEDNRESDTAETLLTTNNMTRPEPECAFFHARRHSNPELPNICNKQKWTTRSKRPINDCEDPRKFNPREPNYLPVVPDPEAEKVDLKHQMMDERKNGEEWMLDYALRRAVTELAPARKRKVALLVEAFETVLPIPKYETHLRRTSAAFAHARPIQACN